MKKVKQQKRGISLIVLVITIIVLIILAAAVILFLDGSNIIERAKGAQSSSDVATAKEIVSVAKSEWAFEKVEGYDTFREYAEAKLEEAGFDMNNTYVEEAGRVLFDTAARFAKAGVPLGATVTGYTLNSTTSYTTSGNENTRDPGKYTETSAQPVELTRDTNPIWTYIGVDEEGNALIAGSVTSTTPKITLGGKGGYINGPAELDAACDAMYSTTKGTARSMNIEDVTRVLEYTGEKGAYWDVDGNYTPLKELLTVGALQTKLGLTIRNIATPESGKAITEYESNYYIIYKENDANEYNTARADLIYPQAENTTLTSTYWISSSCVYTDFNGGSANFNVHYISSTRVLAYFMFDSKNFSYSNRYALRPVIVLASDVAVTYNGTTVTLK